MVIVNNSVSGTFILRQKNTNTFVEVTPLFITSAKWYSEAVSLYDCSHVTDEPGSTSLWVSSPPKRFINWMPHDIWTGWCWECLTVPCNQMYYCIHQWCHLFSRHFFHTRATKTQFFSHSKYSVQSYVFIHKTTEASLLSTDSISAHTWCFCISIDQGLPSIHIFCEVLCIMWNIQVMLLY